MAANQNLFSGMGSNYSPLQQDDDDPDKHHKVGNLFDLGGPSSQSSTQSSFQGAQGASVDPFLTMNVKQATASPVKNPATGSLFDEDDILGVIASSDPIATAAQQSYAQGSAQQAATSLIQPVMMSQQEAIFGQKQLTGRKNNQQQSPYTVGQSNSGLSNDIFAGIGGALPQEEEKKEDLQISANHYMDAANNNQNSQSGEGGMFSNITSYFMGSAQNYNSQGQFTSIGSEQIRNNQKSWFQRFIFDFTAYSFMFETTTPIMQQKLKDAFWPFHPDNQPSELNPANPETHKRVSAFSPNEMYGPLWIMLTIIIEILVIGHLLRTLRAQIAYGVSSDQELQDQNLIEQVVQRYGGVGSMVFDPSAANANVALKNIMRTFFFVLFFFAAVPFCTYLLFISSLDGRPRTYETSWKRLSFNNFSLFQWFWLTQIYGYSMAVYIPAMILIVPVVPYWRAKCLWFLLTVAMSTFYQYKESIQTCKRFLTYSKYVRLTVVICLVNILFGLFIFSVLTA